MLCDCDCGWKSNSNPCRSCGASAADGDGIRETRGREGCDDVARKGNVDFAVPVSTCEVREVSSGETVVGCGNSVMKLLSISPSPAE